jgi:hypothetical protein
MRKIVAFIRRFFAVEPVFGPHSQRWFEGGPKVGAASTRSWNRQH